MTSIKAAPAPHLSRTEFIAMMAILFATIAFSIDSMLPALPRIAADLTSANPNNAQLIITSFVLGMGIGTLFTGPLSDAFGRKSVIIAGAGLYCIGALIAWAAPTLETVLAARLLQGLGAAGPRVVSLAMVRDLYKGREMAKVVSFVMMVFMLVPAIAPLLGSVIINAYGWRAIFLTFVCFSATASLWLGLRQPETLPPPQRRPLKARTLWDALREVLSHRVIVTSILVQTLAFGCLFATLSTTQPVFEVTFGRAGSFPVWFAVIALASGFGSLLNASLVTRLGMRRMVMSALIIEATASGLMFGMTAGDLWPAFLYFPAFVIWTTGVFIMTSLTIGNLNALALEPVGHIAGLAASVIGAISTVLSVMLAIPVGQMFDGTPLPLIGAVGLFSAAGYLLMRTIPRPIAAQT
jgi:MFS transporter, DHA1 family, multidrug resistance protein